MKFVRLFGSGLNETHPDVRSKVFAEFKCDVCGKLSEKDLTDPSVRNVFNFEEERRCPHCKMMGVEDKAKNLQLQIERLTKEKSRIEVQIETLIDELEHVSK